MARAIAVIWDEKSYTTTADFDLYMEVEEKVPLNRIADALSKAGRGKMAELPMTGVAWALFVVLRRAGAPVKNPQDVLDAIFSGKLPRYGETLGALIVGYYGAAPEKLPKKAKAGTLETEGSRPLTSPSATELP